MMIQQFYTKDRGELGMAVSWEDYKKAYYKAAEKIDTSLIDW